MFSKLNIQFTEHSVYRTLLYMDGRAWYGGAGPELLLPDVMIGNYRGAPQGTAV